jgi:hypothetical protein
VCFPILTILSSSSFCSSLYLAIPAIRPDKKSDTPPQVAPNQGVKILGIPFPASLFNQVATKYPNTYEVLRRSKVTLTTFSA